MDCSLYAGVLSEAAESELRRFGVAFEYGRKVPRILNRDRTGPCPTEVLVDDAASPKDALPAIRRFVGEMLKRRGAPEENGRAEISPDAR